MNRDSEFHDAYRRLSIVDSTDDGISRRHMLTRGLGAAGALTAAGILSPWERLSAIGAAGAVPAQQTAPAGLLLLIQLGGGLDGLNTLVPMDGAYGTNYRNYRGSIAVQNPVPLNDPLSGASTGMGLHPDLAFVNSEFAAGRVGLVQGIGYPNSSLSHFDGIATWMFGSAAAGVPTSGWIGRWLDSLAAPSPFQAVQVGTSVPLHLVGTTRRAVAVGSDQPSFGTSSDGSDQLMYSHMGAFPQSGASRGAYAGRIGQVNATALQLNQQTKPLYTSPTPLPEGNELVRRTRLAARLFNANFGVQVISTVHGDYDEHDNEDWRHPLLMQELDAALAGFFAELDPALAAITTVMTFTEFGRKPWANASVGTDHGTANMLLMMGQRVRGGLHGTAADISNLSTWQDPAATGDFRSVYQDVCTNVLGASSSAILGGSYPALNLFT